MEYIITLILIKKRLIKLINYQLRSEQVGFSLYFLGL